VKVKVKIELVPIKGQPLQLSREAEGKGAVRTMQCLVQIQVIFTPCPSYDMQFVVTAMQRRPFLSQEWGWDGLL
jgi:hypothetical protein